MSTGLLPQACRVWLSHDGTSPRERQEEAVKPGVVQAEITDKFHSGVKDPQHCPEGLPEETSQIDPQTCLCALKCRELPFIATPGTVLSTFTNLLNLLNNQKVGTFINSILQRRKLSF